MKQAFKKPLALILALALLLALPMQAFAAPIRETDYFPEKNHTDRPYSDIVFTQPDLEGAQTIIAAIEPLLDDAANIGHVGRLFEELEGVVIHGITMTNLADLYLRKDASDQEVVELYLTANGRMSQINTGVNQLIAQMDASPCREVLLDFMSEDIVKRTVGMDGGPEEQAIKQEIAEMKSQYMSLAAQAPSEERSKAIGSLYVEMVGANNRLARLSGYDNYQDYACDYYGRDYTPGDAARLRKDFKEYAAPYCFPYMLIHTQMMKQESGISEIDAVSPQVQEKVESFLGGVSSELLESYHFMWDKGYYDFEETGPGDQNAFVSYMDELGVPFKIIVLCKVE